MRENLKGLESDLLTAVGERLAKRGFDRRRGQTFYRAFADGWQAVHLAFVEHESDFDVSADVGVRFDQVEDLVNADMNVLSAAEKRETATLGCELGNLRHGRETRWTIGSTADVEHAAEAINEMVATAGLPYFERLGSLASALDALEGDDADAWIHSPIHAERAKRAVALAFLVTDAAQLPALVERKKKFLKERKDPGAAAFSRFSAQLIAKRQSQ